MRCGVCGEELGEGRIVDPVELGALPAVRLGAVELAHGAVRSRVWECSTVEGFEPHWRRSVPLDK
jgi:hypothetical protein